MESQKKIICENALGEAGEFNVDELEFRPGVYGIIVKDEKVLLIPVFEGYDVPGGGVDLGEPILDALKREMKEETGLDIEPKEVLHVGDDFFIHPIKKKPYQGVAIYFRCEIVGGEISDEFFTEDEKTYVKKATWVSISEIDDAKFYNALDNQGVIKRAADAVEKAVKGDSIGT